MDISNINSGLINNTIDSIKNDIGRKNLDTKLKLAYDEKDKAKLKEVCNDFESIMLNIVYKEMRATVPENSLTENSSSMKMYKTMYDEKLMESVTKGNGIGLSKILYNQMVKNIDNLYKIEK